MAWTTPRTWVTDELVTAALMNAHVRDNFNAVTHLLARKTADQSVVSSITPADDTHLSFSVAANEIWQFEFTLIVTGLFDWLGQVAFPSGSIAGYSWGTGAGVSSIAGVSISSISTPSEQCSFRADSTSVPRVHFISGVFSNGASAGTFKLQWAQGVSGGTATMVRTNSTLWGVRIA